VATGGYTLEELHPHRPWRVFSELPPPGDFLALIDNAGRPTAEADARSARA
jgi:hypothetical protein